MNYQQWEDAVPAELKADSLWKVLAYRLALFLSELAWRDASRLIRDRRTANVGDQLYRAVTSVSANIAEGYSRSTGRDRAHFYEYSLGSARESCDWYYKARHVLGDDVTNHRLRLLAEILRLPLTMVPQQRGKTLREPGHQYAIEPSCDAGQHDANALLSDVPMPGGD